MTEENYNAIEALQEVVKSFTEPLLKNKSLKTRPEWHIKPDSGDFDLLLSVYDERNILMVLSGKITPEFGKSMRALVPVVLKETKHDKVPIFIDIRGVTHISWSARKIVRATYEYLIKQLEHFYYLISPNLEGYFKIYFTFYPERKNDTSFVKSIEEGLLLHLNKGSHRALKEPVRAKPDPELFSKDELIALYNQRDEEYETLKKRQLEFMGQIFHVISQITWDDKFKPEILPVDDKESSTLYSALNVLQNDVYEMIQQFKSLNSELENKVILRTDELQKQNSQLEKVNKELDVFLHSTYHDLKRPLASIHTMIKLLREDYFDMEFDDSLKMVEKSVKKLEAFIKEIAIYAKNKSESVALRKINLKDVVEVAIQEEILNLEEKPEVSTTYNLNSDFYTDSFRMNLIVTNIVSNALKFTKDSGTHLVDIIVSVDQEILEIKMKDNGIGIPPEHYHKIFNPFFRSNSDNAGSGLGLYIAKEAAEKIGGEIKFDSSESGTEFVVKLPNLKS